MLVVAADGRYVEPVRTAHLQMLPGERYDVLVFARGERAAHADTPGSAAETRCRAPDGVRGLARPSAASSASRTAATALLQIQRVRRERVWELHRVRSRFTPTANPPTPRSGARRRARFFAAPTGRASAARWTTTTPTSTMPRRTRRASSQSTTTHAARGPPVRAGPARDRGPRDHARRERVGADERAGPLAVQQRVVRDADGALAADGRRVRRRRAGPRPQDVRRQRLVRGGRRPVPREPLVHRPTAKSATRSIFTATTSGSSATASSPRAAASSATRTCPRTRSTSRTRRSRTRGRSRRTTGQFCFRRRRIRHVEFPLPFLLAQPPGLQLVFNVAPERQLRPPKWWFDAFNFGGVLCDPGEAD